MAGKRNASGDASRERIMQFIRGYWKTHLTSPSIREICDGTCTPSVSTASYHINKLILDGELMEREYAISRNYIPTNIRITFD